MNGDYSSEDVLTADDVPRFPNGTATVYRVTLSEEPGRRMALATLDARGVLRSLNEQRAVFRIEKWEVLEAVK